MKEIIYVGGGCLLLYMLIQSRTYNVDVLSNNQKVDMLVNANSPETISNGLSEDNSPVRFQFEGSETDPAEIQQQINSVYDTFSGKVTAIAQDLGAASGSVLSGVSKLLAENVPQGYSITDKGLNMYLEAVGIWVKVYTELNVKIAEQIAIMANSPYDVTKCTLTTYTKEVTELSEQEKEKYFESTVSGHNFQLGLGLLGSGGGKTENLSSGSSSSRTDIRKVAYIPHCDRYEVDPNKVATMLASRTQAYEMLMGQLRVWFANAPDPLAFCVPTPADPVSSKLLRA